MSKTASDDETEWPEKVRAMVGTPCKQCAALGVDSVFELLTETRDAEYCLGGRSVEWKNKSVYLYCPSCKARSQIESGWREGYQKARAELWEKALVEQGMSPEEIEKARTAMWKAVRALSKQYSREVCDSLVAFLTV